MTPNQPPAKPAPEPTEQAPEFHLWFAAISLVVAVAVIAAVVWLLDLGGGNLGLSSAEWEKLDAQGKLGAAVLTPVVLIGAIAVMIGMWMAIVEWRGRFATTEGEERKLAAVDVPKIIEAVGKLRGAALVMVVGALLIFAAAWITQSTSDSSSSTTTTTSTSTTTSISGSGR